MGQIGPWNMQRDLSQYSSAELDRGAHRVKELLWWVVRGLFFLPNFPWPSSLRCLLLQLFGAKVGKGVVIRSGVNITFPWRFKCGDHVWLGEGSSYLTLAPITIESNVCVSQEAYLCTGSHDHRESHFDLITKAIRLKQGSWVGARGLLGPGVVVGENSVVAAGAVVFRSVDSNMVAKGNPATAIKIT